VEAVNVSPDFTQVARRVVDKATGEGSDKRRDPAAVALGRKAGETHKRKAEERRAARQSAE
jgi:hypothetical protein